MKRANKTISVQVALSRMMELCSRSEKSSFEIRQKLTQWGLESKAHSIIKKLSDDKFIDDARFARAFSNDRILINKWGKIKIRYMLRAHQIDGAVINESLSQIDEEKYVQMIEEEMKKKNKSLKISNRYKRKARLYAFGNQRGYEADFINRFFEKEGLY